MTEEIHCNCIEEINADFAKRDEGAKPNDWNNAKILTSMFGRQFAFIATTKRDEKSRKKPAMCIATYCPFCGLKYGDKP